MIDVHVGRSWRPPDPFAPECGCTVLPCGLVSLTEANANGCDQHSVHASRTVRASHRDVDCARSQ